MLGGQPVTGACRLRWHQMAFGGIGHGGAGRLRRSLGAATLAAALAGVLSVPAAAATCTDNFTGPNDGLWSAAANWSSHSVPEPTAVACWPSNITVVVSSDVVAIAAIEGGGLTLESAGLDFYFATSTSSLSGALTVIGSSYLSESYTATPVLLMLGGPLTFSGGQIRNVTIVQAAGHQRLDPRSGVGTARPRPRQLDHHGQPGDDRQPDVSRPVAATTSVSTRRARSRWLPGSSSTQRARRRHLHRCGDRTRTRDRTTAWAADSLIFTGVAPRPWRAAPRSKADPSTSKGGVLQDDGTVGQFTVLGNDDAPADDARGRHTERDRDRRRLADEQRWRRSRPGTRRAG
jgi:hypothetical protein